jgi:hypothetical protein
MTEKLIAPGAHNSARGRDCLAETAGTSEIPQNALSRQPSRWEVRPNDGTPFTVETRGRMTWALGVLANAGKRGVSASELPAGVRWAAYVHKLRLLGVAIEATREPNSGPLGGHHARYRLSCTVRRGEAA